MSHEGEAIAGAEDAPGTATPKRRRLTPRRVLNAVAVVIVLVGVAVLVLPYDTTYEVEAMSVIGADEPIPVRCEGPLLDAFHGESGAWLNYSPDPADAGPQTTLTGTWCAPASLQRGAVGAGIVVFGICFLLAIHALHLRREREDREALETPSGPDGPDSDEPAP